MSYLDMFSLKGKTAIVTGAERGSGLEIAVGFAKAASECDLHSRQNRQLCRSVYHR